MDNSLCAESVRMRPASEFVVNPARSYNANLWTSEQPAASRVTVRMRRVQKDHRRRVNRALDFAIGAAASASVSTCGKARRSIHTKLRY